MKKGYYLGTLKPGALMSAEQMPQGPRVIVAHAGGRADEIFACETVPTFESHGNRYGAVVGPFRTKRAAIFMSRTHPNPHCRTVSEAERLVKKYPELGVVI